MISIKVNNTEIQVPKSTTILEAVKKANINIPTLCHMNLHEINIVNNVANCGVCMVEVAGQENLLPACITEIQSGMEIYTFTEKVRNACQSAVKRILANHPSDCLTCERNLSCELQQLATNLRIREIPQNGVYKQPKADNSSHSIVRRSEKCILCHRCEVVCNKIQTVGVIQSEKQGENTTIGTPSDTPLMKTACTFCAQCVAVCPVGALVEKRDTHNVWEALNDPEKYVVVQTAPSIRVSLGELFGLPAGTTVTGKMVSALRRIGFDKVLDTAFGADVTVTEEATEFLHRLEHGGKLPIITSCCPAWVKFAEHQFPEHLDMPSSCKSPHQIFGAIAKAYMAKKLDIDPKKMVVVSIMPCLSKKFEVTREELSHPEYGSDVDYVISTRELARMIKESCINFHALPDSDFDTIMGESTGAGVGFGTTGGVITAVVRTVSAWLENKPPADINFTELRGFDGIREAEVKIADKTISIAIAHGLGNARKLLEAVQAGEASYHAIEVMACPAGCVGGGGQPYYGNNFDTVKARSKALRSVDEGKPLRMAHENKELQQLYSEFLGNKNGEIAHELLHTAFVKR